MCSEVGVDMDGVEGLQKQYDEFEKVFILKFQLIFGITQVLPNEFYEF